MDILQESLTEDIENVDGKEEILITEHQLSDTQYQSLINSIITRQQNEQSLQFATAHEKEIIVLICDALGIDPGANYQVDSERKMLVKS